MNLIESVDLQRAIRGTAYKKAAQLYGEKNRARGWDPKPTVNQIRGVFRIGYNQLYKRHPRTTWLNFEDKYPGVQAPEPPLELNEAFDKAIEFMDGNDEH